MSDSEYVVNMFWTSVPSDGWNGMEVGDDEIEYKSMGMLPFDMLALLSGYANARQRNFSLNGNCTEFLCSVSPLPSQKAHRMRYFHTF